MEIKTIEEAKKYMGKKIFNPYENRIDTYYIGGVHLFYNQFSYDVMGFEVYENKKCTKGYGKVELDKMQTSFNPKFNWLVYTFSEELAKKYLILINRTEEERERERDIDTAKILLEKHKVKYEIFK